GAASIAAYCKSPDGAHWQSGGNTGLWPGIQTLSVRKVTRWMSACGQTAPYGNYADRMVGRQRFVRFWPVGGCKIEISPSPAIDHVSRDDANPTMICVLLKNQINPCTCKENV